MHLNSKVSVDIITIIYQNIAFTFNWYCKWYYAIDDIIDVIIDDIIDDIIAY